MTGATEHEREGHRGGGRDPQMSRSAVIEQPPLFRSYGTAAICGLVSVALLLSTLVWPERGLPFGPATSTAVAWGLFALHIFVSRRLLNAFDLVIWIPVIFLLQYLGMGLAIEWLGYVHPTGYDGFDVGRQPPHLEQAFALAALCITSLLFGIHLAGLKDLSRSDPTPPREKRSVVPAALCIYWGGLAMIVVGVPLAGASLLFGNYADMKLASNFAQSDFRFVGSGALFFQAGIFGLLAGYHRRRPWLAILGFGGAAALSLFLLVTGDRGGLAALVFGVGWVTMVRVHRIPHWVAVSAFVSMFLLMPAIGEWRVERAALDTLKLPLQDILRSPIYHMGASIQTFAYSLDLIPAQKGYAWGGSFGAALLVNVPNLGRSAGHTWWWDFDPYEYLPSVWYVATLNPVRWLTKGGGWAYSYGAEWYFNFGKPGILFGLALTGYLTARIRNASLTSSFKLTAACLFVAMMAIAIRNALSYPLRTALWPFIALSILYWLIPQTPSLQPLDASRRRSGFGELRADASSGLRT
jgi:oligosaccharide repeat unit polymerase